MALYEQLADLPVTIEEYDASLTERATSSGFTRTTTTIELHGENAVGYGEDVIYDTERHHSFVDQLTTPPTGAYTHRTFSEAVGALDLAPDPTDRAYRRWGFESAALDLALKQAGTNFAAALDQEYDPIRFVVSTRLGDPPTFERVETLLEQYPSTEFKLDPTSEWTPDLIDRLAGTGRVRILDLKGHYEGTEVDQPPDLELYEQVLERFSEAIIEDPALTDETEELLAPHTERISWDAPIHGVTDIEALPFEPSVLNVKPSRFGSLESVLETIEYCKSNGIKMYGGGQFELGVGREHVHAIASLFYPDGTNDVAPAAYNDPNVTGSLPVSPLTPPEQSSGLGWS
ncbi:enolase-like domain-containing protein [Halocatena pleomorpha]|uniref:Enolase n=1 Tax=Halocatena pleomorpha TaxID=1785090 RepID=A0A3P3RD74_9EURY|nr:hypothetical protein [Halocatena pleomorpha]RRJ31284.1 hypothetical protein EIK79_07760 [Halocatena pleomorpha]